MRVFLALAMTGLLLFVSQGGCNRGGVDANEPPPVEPTPAPNPGPAGDLCEGLVQDLGPRPMTALARPSPGSVVVDPQFGTRIRRITAVSTAEGANAVIKPAYGTIRALSARWLACRGVCSRPAESPVTFRPRGRRARPCPLVRSGGRPPPGRRPAPWHGS